MFRAFFLGLLLIIAVSSPSFSAFHNMYLGANQKDLNYFLLPHLYGGSLASAVSFDFAPDNDRSAEIFLMGYNSPLAYSGSSVNLLGLLAKQKLLSGGNLSFTGIIGLGALYSSSAGLSFAPNLGGSLGYAFSPQLKFSVPVVVSVYKDGGLIDYAGGIAYTLPGGRELIVGAKGIVMTVLTTNLMAFQNSLYGMVGLRAYF